MSRTLPFPLKTENGRTQQRGKLARERFLGVRVSELEKAVFIGFPSECLKVRALWLQSEAQVMAEIIINDIVLHAAELLRSLEGAGPIGSPRAELVAGKGRKGKEEALATLIARREVLNVGNTKKPRFALARLCDRLELARIAIEEKAVAGRANLFSRRELAEGCPPAAEEELDAALDELVRERRLIRAERGKTTYYLHTAALGTLTTFDARWQGATSRAATVLTVDRIQQAYREIVRDTGFSDVTISELQRRAGVALEALKRWLLEESRAGRVLPTRGDWSLADGDSRAAAIDIAGEPHLRVRITP